MFLAEMEFFGIDVLPLLFAASWLLWYCAHKAQEEKDSEAPINDILAENPKTAESLKAFDSVGWSKQKTFPIPLDMAKEIAEKVYGESLECHLEDEAETVQRFSRGDKTIWRLPIEKSVDWYDQPVTIQIRYKAVSDEKTTMKVVYAAPKSMIFDGECRDFFVEHAQKEFLYFCQVVENVCKRYEEHVASEIDETDCSADYGTLGVGPDASWDDVRAAYREN